MTNRMELVDNGDGTLTHTMEIDGQEPVTILIPVPWDVFFGATLVALGIESEEDMNRALERASDSDLAQSAIIIPNSPEED